MLLSVAVLLFLSTLAASTPKRGRPLGAGDIRIDISPATKVLALWDGRGEAAGSIPNPATAAQRRVALQIATSAPYRTLRAFQVDQSRCFASDEEIGRVLLYPESLVCGISLAPAYRDRAALDSLLEEIARRDLRKQIASSVARYLPTQKSWKAIRIWFVLSSRWSFDAATLSEGGEGDPVVIVNATELLGYEGTTKERVDILEHVLAHEAFHAAIRQLEGGLPGWAGYGPRARSAYAHIARVLLDEGVAHLIDWRSRPGSDSLFTTKPGAREKHAFSQLQLAAKRLGQRDSDPGSIAEIVQLASSGPVWSKYGAISGMFAAYRIESRLGVDSLRAAVVGGPLEFARMYGAVAAADTSLGRVPGLFSEPR